MIRLLRSNLQRLVKCKVFWACLSFSIVFNLYYILTSSSGYTENYFFGGAAGATMVCGLLGLNIAATSAILFGTDYSNGTIRNKIITGKRRSEIYFANFTTSVIIGLIFTAVFYFLLFAIGFPVLGSFSDNITMLDIVLNLVCTLFIIFSYASIFTFINMLSRNLTVGIVSSIMCIVAAIVASILLDRVLSEPPTADVFEYIDGIHVYIGNIPNPKYIESPSLRKFIEVVMYTSPTGQSYRLLMDGGLSSKMLNFYQYVGASASVVAITNTTGYLIFRKMDLK